MECARRRSSSSTIPTGSTPPRSPTLVVRETFVSILQILLHCHWKCKENTIRSILGDMLRQPRAQLLSTNSSSPGTGQIEMKFIAYLRIKEIQPKVLKSQCRLTYFSRLVEDLQPSAVLQPGLQSVSPDDAFLSEVDSEFVTCLRSFYAFRMTSPNPLHVSYLGQILLRYGNPIFFG